MTKAEKLKEILPDIPDAHGNLKKEGATSLCGPCPKCGGNDRFVYMLSQRPIAPICLSLFEPAILIMF